MDILQDFTTLVGFAAGGAAVAGGGIALIYKLSLGEKNIKISRVVNLMLLGAACTATLVAFSSSVSTFVLSLVHDIYYHDNMFTQLVLKYPYIAAITAVAALALTNYSAGLIGERVA